MSTFWHKMSDLKPVCSIKMWKLTEKSYFCALSVTFLRLVYILKLEDLLQDYVKWKNTMTFNVNFLTQNVGPWTCYKQFIWGYWPKNHIFVPFTLHFWGWCAFLSWKISFKAMLSGKTQWRVMSTFWHKMSDLKPVCSIKMWKLTEKSYFCALSVTFLRLVCIFKLEDLLQDNVKWKNTMTFNVNFLTQNVGPWTCYKQCIWGYWTKNHIFVPFTLHFWGWCAF